MERNWLIRTTQNQILGPITKEKLLEFLSKGALGLNDEVCSGNGYWFSIKEKDLVEKYLSGDVPQSFNPISESKSVLALNGNPHKTTSFNVPAVHHAHLESSSDMTMVSSKLSRAALKEEGEVMKLPNKDDLEFPDLPARMPPLATSSESLVQQNLGPAIPLGEPKTLVKETVHTANTVNTEAIVYPKGADLDYPDREVPGQVEEKASEERDFKLKMPPPPVKEPSTPIVIPEKVAVALETLSLGEQPQVPVAHVDSKEKNHDKEMALKAVIPEDKKLLHERKRKLAPKNQEENEKAKAQINRAMPEHLKKRNDNYLMFVLIILVLAIVTLFIYYYRTILNKPLLG